MSCWMPEYSWNSQAYVLLPIYYYIICIISIFTSLLLQFGLDLSQVLVCMGRTPIDVFTTIEASYISSIWLWLFSTYRQHDYHYLNVKLLVISISWDRPIHLVAHVYMFYPFGYFLNKFLLFVLQLDVGPGGVWTTLKEPCRVGRILTSPTALDVVRI
jgi:hypothetical protein